MVLRNMVSPCSSTLAHDNKTARCRGSLEHSGLIDIFSPESQYLTATIPGDCRVMELNISWVCRTTHLPKLLAGIFSSYSLQDLGSTRMFIHEASHLIYIIVDNNMKALLDTPSFFDIVGSELFRHGGSENGTWTWDSIGNGASLGRFCAWCRCRERVWLQQSQPSSMILNEQVYVY